MMLKTLIGLSSFFWCLHAYLLYWATLSLYSTREKIESCLKCQSECTTMEGVMRKSNQNLQLNKKIMIIRIQWILGPYWTKQKNYKTLMIWTKKVNFYNKIARLKEIAMITHRTVADNLAEILLPHLQTNNDHLFKYS
jgi:hypothetical protein